MFAAGEQRGGEKIAAIICKAFMGVKLYSSERASLRRHREKNGDTRNADHLILLMKIIPMTGKRS